MSDRKTFEYGGYHFTPIRKFHKKEGDFFAISKRLASEGYFLFCGLIIMLTPERHFLLGVNFFATEESNYEQ